MLLTDIAESLQAHGFKNVIFIGDSGGNQKGQQTVADKLTTKWAGKALALHIGEYYDYDSVAKYMEGQGVKAGTSDNMHDDPIITLNMFIDDPNSVRYDARVKAGKATINGVNVADRKKNTELAKKIVEFRATKTIEAINKHIAAKSKTTSSQNNKITELQIRRKVSEREARIGRPRLPVIRHSSFFHSHRSAVTGATRAARSAGMQVAATDAMPSATAAATKVIGSVALTPNSSRSIRRVPAAAPSRPIDDAEAGERHTVAHHHPHHVGPLRAERHADADLARSLTDDVRHHAVDADQRERHREQREARKQQRREARLRHRRRLKLLHRPHPRHRQLGIDARARPCVIVAPSTDGSIRLRATIVMPPS